MISRGLSIYVITNSDLGRVTFSAFKVSYRVGVILSRDGRMSHDSMVLFIQLPNEIVVAILERISIGDIESISLVCKHVHLLARPMIESHRKLKKRYGYVSNQVRYEMRNKAIGYPPSRVLSGVLYDVLRDPDLGFYVREIELHDWHYSFEEDALPLDAVAEDYPDPHRPYPHGCISKCHPLPTTSIIHYADIPSPGR